MHVTNLNGWRAVEAVYRLGSLSAAAEELGVTKAAVASQLRGLEAVLGRSLFTRTSGGLEPAAPLLETGERLKAAMAGLAAVQTALSEKRPSNRVALSVTQTFAETWLPRHMQDLFSKLAKIDLRLITSWDLVDLNDANLDFAIRYMGEVETGVESLWLMRSGVVPVCTPDFAKRYNLSEDRWDLTGVPLIHINVQTTDPDWADWPRWRRDMGVPSSGATGPQPRYELVGSGVRLASSGVGLVLGGLSEVYGALDEGRLIMPFGKASVLPGQYAHKLIWPADRRLGPIQRKFCDWIDEKAKSDRALMQRIFGLAQV